MPDLFELFFRWWRQIVLLVIVTVVLTIVVLFFVPEKYLGVATALPAPAYAADKTSVFSQNLQNLYSTLGSPDDLDKILGTARLDTVYMSVASRLNLAEHYQIKRDTDSLQKAAYILKDKTRVIKTDYGELQVKVWDTDKSLAANLANAIMEKLQQIHQDVQTLNNALLFSEINKEYAEKNAEYQNLHDSLSRMDIASAAAQIFTSRQAALLQQMQEYQELAGQYKLMMDAKPQALIIIERAKPALKADEPRKLQVIVVAAILSLVFGFFAALVLEKKRKMTS
ncbi:MAG TPA: hypothetical protein VGI82_02690 [Chitinophagaceae bacterium]|jgi:uncharacterized protein involved in exopolysaccharide biosynthesis